MKFEVAISNIQQVKSIAFELDLSLHKLTCLVGKNSVGKTTLVKAIRNIKYTDTFQRTASPLIFNPTSRITYKIGHTVHQFKYNPKLRAIDTRDVIDREFIDGIYVELPIPHGDRFSRFKTLSEIDGQLRKNIAIENYQSPTDLISFLRKVYRSDRFDNLKESTIKKEKYYFILRDNNFYIREDYLSSGEYFVINLHKMITKAYKFIVIDEIDISLDASAQIHLIGELRHYCLEFGANIVFTTHSLALLKTLQSSEIYYLDNVDGQATVTQVSYNFINSILFGFTGWDKYLLTEDEVLQKYIAFLLTGEVSLRHCKYTIIHIGGAHAVVGLMERNRNELFFSDPANVITVLDGDVQSQFRDARDVVFIPFRSVEHQLELLYRQGRGPLPDAGNFNSAKHLLKILTIDRRVPHEIIFEYINASDPGGVRQFKESLVRALIE